MCEKHHSVQNVLQIVSLLYLIFIAWLLCSYLCILCIVVCVCVGRRFGECMSCTVFGRCPIFTLSLQYMS